MPESSKPPSLLEFFRVLWEDWGSRVSGALSVPFTAAALFASAALSRILWACLALLAVLATVYQIWAKERSRVIKVTSELERSSSPQFVGRINDLSFGQSDAGCPFGLFSITVKNLGAPSSAIGWQVRLKKPLDDHATAFPPMVFIHDQTFSTNKQVLLVVQRSDMIFEKMVAPLQRGGIVSGYLIVHFPGMSQDQIVTKGAEWAVVFLDVNDREYAATLNAGELKPPQGMVYYPGAGTTPSPGR